MEGDEVEFEPWSLVIFRNGSGIAVEKREHVGTALGVLGEFADRITDRMEAEDG